MTTSEHAGQRRMLRILSRVLAPLRPRTNLKALSSAASPASAVKPMMELKLYRAPPEVRGMTSLDKEAFTQTITVPALRVPTGVLNKVVKSLRKSAIQRPGVPRVVQDKEQSSDFRLVLLDPYRVTSSGSFSEAEAEALKSFGVCEELQYYELRLTYHNLKSEEVLEAVLPQGQDVTSGFSRVGHIAHMNLRDHQLPYKNLIGEVIMDKNPGVTCVVNKTNIIDTTYRYFKMEVLAGEENMVAKVKENGVTYEFDFSRVYWNPRLSTEHQRVVDLVKRGDTVFDVFAGVGPFAIPAARSGANVLANDLNPESYRWLQHNCKLNKVEKRVRNFNLDGRAFIQGPVKQELPALMKGKAGNRCSVHFVQNFPLTAVRFLSKAKTALQSNLTPVGSLRELKYHIVACQYFWKTADIRQSQTQRGSHSLGSSREETAVKRLYEAVAPNPGMQCRKAHLPTYTTLCVSS
ncbi:tRNA (guanine(37)-N1)-methyltransferase [Collichthys lucidus]|uniref:tRNA (guanine(37)-N1)-methyltransferase n=1 Tax=Collichthys lucidus TaxID=240159 RepID=A0A4U5VEV4_COLLU|nr:tRNA (guanine(37)-N1)-methyltransferase [Collichthys lucidus]